MSRTLVFKQTLLGLLILATSSLALAFEKQAFSEAKLMELQKNDAVVIVDVFATWCPTCAKQQRVFKKYSEKYPENDFHVLIIDYDKDKELVKKYKAPRQSTLVLFKGEKQLWYSVAESDYSVIEGELNKAFEL